MRRTLAFLLLMAAACASGGSDQGPPDPPESGTYPLTVTLGRGDVSLEARPQRIVSLSPTATEMLFAIGAGEQVVAVDEFSTYPEEAPVTDLSGYTPNLEAVTAYDPDLVVVSDDLDGIVSGLRQVGIPVAHLPAARNLEEVYGQIESLGLLTDHLTASARLTAEMREEIESLLVEVPQPAEPLTYYHELDTGLYSITSSTFIGQIYALFGLESIADEADEAGTGYPRLSAEYVIEQDPDVIFLADTQCCGVTAETLAERPGWQNLTAIESGRVYPVDQDIASRWGPRIVDYMAAVADAVAQVVAG